MVDAADLKSASRKGVGVRIPSWAPVEQARAGVAKVVKELASQLCARENLVEPFPHMPVVQRSPRPG